MMQKSQLLKIQDCFGVLQIGSHLVMFVFRHLSLAIMFKQKATVVLLLLLSLGTLVLNSKD